MQYVGAKLEINQLTAIEEEIGKGRLVDSRKKEPKWKQGKWEENNESEAQSSTHRPTCKCNVQIKINVEKI